MSTKTRWTEEGRVRWPISLAALIALMSATGCSNFFPPLNTTTSGSTVVNTGDYVYVASVNTSNSATPVYSLAGFSIGTGTLTALPNLPTTLPFAPSTAVVTPSNALLYVAGSEVVYGYTIAANGALTSISNSNSSTALVNVNILQMVVSPDGNWLLGLDGTLNNGSVATIHVYPISSTGQLGTDTPVQYSIKGGATIIPEGIAVSPDGTYVAVALGTGGDLLFSFTTATGVLTEVNQIDTGSTSGADQAVAFDSTSKVLFVAQSGTGLGVIPFTISNGGGTLTKSVGAPFLVGQGPSSMVVDKTGTYLYVGDKTDNTISGFTIGTGAVLVPLSGSPYASGTSISALEPDNSGKYLLSTSLGTPDLKMYTLDTTTGGKLDPTTSANTGFSTEPAGAVAIALTHPSAN